MKIFKTIETLARRGAEGIEPGARTEIAQAILQRTLPDGGQADLSGKQSDPYYSLFGWLCLRALQDITPETLVAYFKSCACKNPIDLYSKQFVCLQGLPAFQRPWVCLRILLRQPPSNPYTLLLSGLLMESAFPHLTPLLLNLVRLPPQPPLSTSRLAAYLLVKPRSRHARQYRDILLSRQAPAGGFASAELAAPDLLATAAARLALLETPVENTKDLLFAEACWAPNGLFAPHPGLPEGDVEHTFYALLVLGCCRREA
jgi:hypothetical protein